MKAVQAIVMIVVCAVAVAWIGDIAVSQRLLSADRQGVHAMPFAHDEAHHRRHHGADDNRGINELLGSSMLFVGVAAAVVIPSILIGRRSQHK